MFGNLCTAYTSDSQLAATVLDWRITTYLSPTSDLDAGEQVHMGWVHSADCLTAPREIGYDAALEQLLSNPVDELKALRGDVLGSSGAAPLAPGQVRSEAIAASHARVSFNPVFRYAFGTDYRTVD
jgi:hypothetical protein